MTGVVRATGSYDPYGIPLEMSGDLTTSLGFTGEQTDPNGLLYLRARYANLATATFLTRDPFEGVMQRVMSRNGYSYVEGNPVNLTDPSGENPLVAAIVGLCANPATAIACIGAAAILGTIAVAWIVANVALNPAVQTVCRAAGQNVADLLDSLDDVVTEPVINDNVRRFIENMDMSGLDDPVPGDTPDTEPGSERQRKCCPIPPETRDDDRGDVIRVRHYSVNIRAILTSRVINSWGEPTTDIYVEYPFSGTPRTSTALRGCMERRFLCFFSPHPRHLSLSARGENESEGA